MKRIKFRKFAGVRIQGKVDGPGPGPSHLDRAAWLTAQVESGGKYGAVISYDGTGMTAGVHQAIAVYPRAVKQQGPLWGLLGKIFAAIPDEEGAPGYAEEKHLREILLRDGTVVDSVGVARTNTGSRLGGLKLREILSGSADGVMPVAGPGKLRAEEYAQAFSDLFAHPATFKIQDSYGTEHFVKRSKKILPGRGKSILSMVYGGKELGFVMPGEDIPIELDLAMSMFWSNNVNAPSVALKKLAKVMTPANMKDPKKLARAIIVVLGNTTFGRWDDDIPSGRYQRTRKAAMKLWPKELFVGPNAIMPKDLPG